MLLNLVWEIRGRSELRGQPFFGLTHWKGRVGDSGFLCLLLALRKSRLLDSECSMKAGSQDTWVPSTWNRAGNRVGAQKIPHKGVSSSHRRSYFPPGALCQALSILCAPRPSSSHSSQWELAHGILHGPVGWCCHHPHLIEAQRGQELPPGHTARPPPESMAPGPPSLQTLTSIGLSCFSTLASRSLFPGAQGHQ